jgi:uncharacterized protein YecE (DUF72 family)
VQLPPYLRKDPAVLEDFLGRYATQGKLAFEFRHESWFEDGVYDLLAKYGAAFGVVEAEEREARREVTGPFVYVRLRKGEYSKAELRDWAKWMRSQSVDVFCYMKHDERAPVLAREMLAALEKV